LYIFWTPVLIRHLLQLAAFVFLHRCLICATLFELSDLIFLCRQLLLNQRLEKRAHTFSGFFGSCKPAKREKALDVGEADILRGRHSYTSNKIIYWKWVKNRKNLSHFYLYTINKYTNICFYECPPIQKSASPQRQWGRHS